MVTIGLDEARADIAGLLDRVERGEDVLITRELRVPTEISATKSLALQEGQSPKSGALISVGTLRPSTASADGNTMKEALLELDEFRATMPASSRPSAEILRELRDEGY